MAGAYNNGVSDAALTPALMKAKAEQLAATTASTTATNIANSNTAHSTNAAIQQKINFYGEIASYLVSVGASGTWGNNPAFNQIAIPPTQRTAAGNYLLSGSQYNDFTSSAVNSSYLFTTGITTGGINTKLSSSGNDVQNIGAIVSHINALIKQLNSQIVTNSKSYVDKNGKKVVGGNSGGTTPPPPSITAKQASTPFNIDFNLPPHKWSLPVDPSNLETGVNTPRKVSDALRRGVMWQWQYSSNTTASNSVQLQQDSTSTKIDGAYGFQFLYNPQNLENSVSLNQNIVPNITDKYAAVGGLFTGLEQVAVDIYINRQNDFACFRGAYDWSNGAAPEALTAQFANYYTGNGYPSTPTKPVGIGDKLVELTKLGTMHDVEYIYRMVNGKGTTATPWTNALGRQTADLAFLTPNAIAMRFGPNTDSLSYIGWCSQIQVNHTMFTEDMIPIETTVSLNFSIFSLSNLQA